MRNLRDWKARYQIFFNESITSTEGSIFLFSLPRLGRPPTLSDYLTTKIKLILNNLGIAGCAISRKVVISLGNRVLAASQKAAENWREHDVVYQMGT